MAENTHTTYKSEDGKVTLAVSQEAREVVLAIEPVDRSNSEQASNRFSYDMLLSTLIGAVGKWALLYREDGEERLEFDSPYAYRQRRATTQEIEELSEDGWIDNGWIDSHDEIIDADEYATIADLFEAE